MAAVLVLLWLVPQKMAMTSIALLIYDAVHNDATIQTGNVYTKVQQYT